MATAQINARINSETKANGDRAFADIGCTPTHIIRLVWEFVEHHKGDKETLRDFVGRLDEKSVAVKDDLGPPHAPSIVVPPHHRCPATALISFVDYSCTRSI